MAARRTVFGLRNSLALAALSALAATIPPQAYAQASVAASLGAITTGEDVAARSADIQTKIALVDASKDLDADTKSKVLDRYRSALRTLAEIAVADEAAKRFAEESSRAVADTAANERKLLTLLRTPSLSGLDKKSLVELDADRSAREAKVEELKQLLSAITAERTARAMRTAEINQLLGDAEDRRAELRRQLDSPGTEGEPASLTLARRTDVSLKLEDFDRSLTLLRNEKAKYEAEDRAQLLRSREELTQAQLAQEEAAVRKLREVVAERRQQEAAEKINRARLQAELANPLLRPLATQIQADAEQNGSLQAEIADVERATAAMKRELEALDARFRDIRQKELDIGLTRPIGMMLREQRAGFPDLRKIEEELESRQERMEEVRLASWKCDDLIAALPDAGTFVADRVRETGLSNDALTPTDLDELERAAGDLLRDRWERLSEAKTLNNGYFQALFELDAADQRYLKRSREYLHYINERILWTRSADPLTVDAVQGDAASRRWLLSIGNWKGLLATAASDPLDHPFAFWPTLAAVAALAYVRLRLRPRLRALGGHATKRGFLRYGPTWQAAVLTLMSAVTAPAVLLFLSWRLAEADDPNGFCKAVAAALEICAAVLFPVEVLREACRHMGLAEAHFSWPGRAVSHLRRALTWMKTLGLPVTFLAVLAHSHDPLSGGMPTDRVLFIAGMVLAALTVHRLLSGKSELSRAFLAELPKSLFSRYRPLWYGVAVTVPLGFAGLSAAGYHYSATQVAERLLWTLWLAAGMVLVRAMAVRWVVLSRRRLLLDQVHQKRNAEESQDGAAKPAPIEETDVAKTTAQTRKLVDIVMLGFAATGLAMIWADTMPAIGLLDRPLWSTTEGVAAPAADAAATSPNADAASPATAAPAEAAGTPVKRFDVAVALMIATFTLVASRNLPGLIEMTVLNRLPVDPATRYAATRLASYTIVFVGLMMASNRVGLRWQNIQWLAAALTLGLGFGLQEVFANFVSGLIILFERPVRVGDVVTIDGVTGVVSRIRMRATTITNWDRKEFIVPNKEFITGRVLNWTLTDAVNRVEIAVGVAYGSDPDHVRELLLRICREHPLVLKDPAPSSTFEAFGDSTLDFVTRCFLPSLDLRPDVVHELHTRIDREFRRAGIDIAFPQRDLHIRSVHGLTLPIPTAPRPHVERAAG